jgi:hypothetical protein
MNLIPCKLISIPYTPIILEAGTVLKCKNKEVNSFHILTDSDIKNGSANIGTLEPILLYLGINQPMEEYYFRDYYIELAPPNRPVVKRVTEEVVKLWMLSGEKVMHKYFKIIAKPEVIGAVFNKKIKGEGGKTLNEYSLINETHLESIANNGGNCSVEIKHPIKDSDSYILNFINNKVIIHLTDKGK